jgi:uncharacterized membrane protein
VGKVSATEDGIVPTLLIDILLWSAAISSGLMAGIYFAFSSFVMPAFGKIEISSAIPAMNSINAVILHSWFMPLFFGSSIIALLLIIVGLMNWTDSNSGLLLIAASIYVFGMFLTTAVFNVPLNNQLAQILPDSPDAYQIWNDYLRNWTKWNHLRTVSSLLSCIIYIRLI